MCESRYAEIVRTGFDGLAKGDPAPWLGMFSDEVVWKVLPETRFPTEVQGMTRVWENLFNPLLELLEEQPRFELIETIAEDDRVVALARGTARTKSGALYDQNYCFIYRFAGDKIVEVDERLNTALVNRLFG